MSGIDGRMIDKNAYSTETLNTFSFISAYFIDLYYNHLYTQAIRFHRNQQVATITDGYKASLDAYLQSINNYDKELYSDLVHGIHNSFMEYGFRGITYQACIDKIVKEFVPQDYWKIISFDDKSKILGTIITNSSRAMVHKIISSHLSDIIDNHGDADNANILQDELIEILIMEREKLYHEFINAKTNNGAENGLFQAMEKEILELSKQKNELRHQNHDLKKELLDSQKKLLMLSKHTKGLIAKVKELEAALEQANSAKNSANKQLEIAQKAVANAKSVAISAVSTSSGPQYSSVHSNKTSNDVSPTQQSRISTQQGGYQSRVAAQPNRYPNEHEYSKQPSLQSNHAEYSNDSNDAEFDHELNAEEDAEYDNAEYDEEDTQELDNREIDSTAHNNNHQIAFDEDDDLYTLE